MRAPAVGALAALLCLTACESSVEQRRTTLCRRALPAVVPAETHVTVLRVGSGASQDSVRVDYRANGDLSRQRWMICGFGAGAELLSIATEQGTLNGAALYLLKRYYLDTPDAAAADPATASH